MKQIYLVICITCLTSGLIAQPVLQSTDILPEGDGFYTLGSAMNILPPGNAGADQIWDFSSLTSIFDFEMQFQAVTNQAGANLFPNANYVFSEIDGGFNQFYSLNEDSLSIIGLATDIDEELSYATFTDPFNRLQFPLEYENVYSDSFSLIDGASGNLANQGSFNCTVDAYGTLILPSGSFVNTMRIKRDGENILYLLGPDGEIFDTLIYEITEYEYYAAGYALPLLTYSIGDQDTSISYLTNVVSSTYQPSSAHYNLFPNPAINFFTIEAPSEIISVSIRDLRDRLIKSYGTNEIKHAQVYSIDCSDMLPGIYLAQIRDRSGYHTRKLAVRK